MSASGTKKAGNKVARSEVVNDKLPGNEPTAASLRDSPPLDAETGVSFGRGEEGLKLARSWSRAVRGRPKKGVRAGGTSTRSIRLQNEEWAAVDAFAKARHLTPHGALREAIVHWLARVQLQLDEQAAAKSTGRAGAQSKPAGSRARTSRARAS